MRTDVLSLYFIPRMVSAIIIVVAVLLFLLLFLFRKKKDEAEYEGENDIYVIAENALLSQLQKTERRWSTFPRP